MSERQRAGRCRRPGRLQRLLKTNGRCAGRQMEKASEAARDRGPLLQDESAADARQMDQRTLHRRSRSRRGCCGN